MNVSVSCSVMYNIRYALAQTRYSIRIGMNPAKIPRMEKIREREWRQMAIEIIAVSRYSWLGRPLACWLAGWLVGWLDGRWSISAVVRRTQIKSVLFVVPSAFELRSLAILYFIVHRLYRLLTRVAGIIISEAMCALLHFVSNPSDFTLFKLVNKLMEVILRRLSILYKKSVHNPSVLSFSNNN